MGWWFIPIANLFMPCVAMLELDRRSTPDGVARRASPLIGVWWAAWLVYWVLPTTAMFSAAIGPISDMVDRVDQRTTTFDISPIAHAIAPWLLVTPVLLAFAAALAVPVVRRIDAAHDAMLQAPSGSQLPVPARPDAIA